MHRSALILGLAIGLGALAGCGTEADGNSANTGSRSEAKAGNGAVSSKTIAVGLEGNGKFIGAAKAAGLDQALGGRDYYTVLVPSDAAFAKLPAGTLENLSKPESRTQLTSMLTYHILPGTMLVDDLGKAVDNGKGKAVLGTMGGAMVTATREDGKIAITDGNGQKVLLGQPEEKYANGVVHRIDTVLTPARD